jgi:cytoskeletal protein CcmA (bactofilin family)
LGKNKITLRKTAFLEGNVTTKILVVEEGAKINGLCKMGDTSVVNTKEYGETALNDVEN